MLKPIISNVYKEMEEYNQAIMKRRSNLILSIIQQLVTLHELGRLDKAEASYNQAIALKPDYAEAYNNLGNTFHETGRKTTLAEASCRHSTLKIDLCRSPQLEFAPTN